MYGSVGLDRYRQAAICSPGQVFTEADCRTSVGATLTALTSEQAVMDVDGRQVTTRVNLHGSLPGNVVGRPVRVTFYRGVAVHIEGGDLNFDTAAAPVDRVHDLRFAGAFFLIGGTFLVGANALIQSVRKAGSR